MALFANASTIHGSYFQFEDKYTSREIIDWVTENSRLPIIGVIVYMIAMHVGIRFMQQRKPLAITPLLFLWNAGLAVYSIFAVYRFITAIRYHVSRSGIINNLCTNNMEMADNVSAYHAYAFTISKFVEMGDTIFLVLRKKPMLFLHWYHHSTVLLLCWLSTVYMAPTSAVFATVNLVVHSVMYTYYAFSAIGIKLPKAVAVTITMLQISQMVVGLVSIYTSYVVSLRDVTCFSPRTPMIAALVIYASYFGLFVNFAVRRYLLTGSKQKLGVKAD